MAVRILLAALDQATKDSHGKILSDFKVEYDWVDSHTQIIRSSSENAYNGVFIDERLYVSGNDEVRNTLRDLMDIYPVLRIRSDSEWVNDWSYFNKMEYFLTRSCTAFQPRLLRAFKRVPVILNVLLSNDLTWSPARCIPTVTINVSEGGCFLLHSQQWKYKNTVYFTIQELGPDKPVTGEIRWHIEWGKGMRFPGFGIKFKQIDASQIQKLLAIIHEPAISKQDPG